MDDKLELKKDQPVWILDTVEKDFQRLYDHFRKVSDENTRLRKEIERIKSEKYKDEELSQMKEKYDSMMIDYYRGFPISEQQSKKIREWMDNLTKDEEPTKIATFGGRFDYHFIPTSVGIIGIVEDTITGEKFTFQELG